MRLGLRGGRHRYQPCANTTSAPAGSEKDRVTGAPLDTLGVGQGCKRAELEFGRILLQALRVASGRHMAGTPMLMMALEAFSRPILIY